MTPKVAAAAATATYRSARNLLRNLLALARISPEGAAAAATARVTFAAAAATEEMSRHRNDFAVVFVAIACGACHHDRSDRFRCKRL